MTAEPARADGNILRPNFATCDARMVDRHSGQLNVTVETVRELVSEQFPAWRGLPIQAVDSQGTVNAIFRIGDQFVARFPLQRLGAASAVRSMDAEATAARELLGRTRFRTPDPSRGRNAKPRRGSCRHVPATATGNLEEHGRE